MKNFSNLLFEKKEFLILVFFNLIVQLAITYYVMERIDTTLSYWWIALMELGLVVLLCLPMPSVLKLLFFCIFSYLGGLLCKVIKKTYSEDEIKASMEGTFMLFGAMMLFGIFMVASGIKIGNRLGVGLFISLCALIVIRMMTLLTNVSNLNKFLSIFTLILFSVYVIYDTYNIFSKDYKGDFISASLDYYLNILNMFTSISNSN